MSMWAVCVCGIVLRLSLAAHVTVGWYGCTVTAASSSGARAPAASSGPVMGINGPASSAKV